MWIHIKNFLFSTSVRSLKRIIVALFTVFLVWFILRNFSPRKQPISAIGCKNRLAEFLWPNIKEREKAIKPLGDDVFALEDEYFTQVASMTQQCFHQIHLGPEEEGGWEACVYEHFDIKLPCLVYSFGIGHDFRFELDIEKRFGCEVYAFDPSMNTESHQYSEKGYFYNIGIDNIDGSPPGLPWTMKRLGSIIKILKHEKRAIDYMKMDVEFSEWLALHDIMKSGYLPKIRQLVVETHTPEMDIHDQPEHKCTWTTKETLAAMTRVLIELKNSGMGLYYTRTNYRTQFHSDLTGLDRYCCHNLHFVNNKFDKTKWTL